MKRDLLPHEILITACIFAVLAAGLFGGGFAVGNSKATNNNLTSQLAAFRESCKESIAENSFEMKFYPFDDEGDKIPDVAIGCHQKGLTDQQVADQIFERQNPLRVNVECHGDASDWATVRVANEIGYEHDLPVFVHGNCMTHEVVDVAKASGRCECTPGMNCAACGMNAEYETNFTLSTCWDSQGHKIDCDEMLEGWSGNFCDQGTKCHEKITNVPQPEGQ